MSVEHDPNLIYEVRRLIPLRLHDEYPAYALLERQKGDREIAPYPGVLFVDEHVNERLGALEVRWRKVPGWYATKMLEKQHKEREASR